MINFFQTAAALADGEPDAPFPVETWHPSHCGEMDLVIRADGTWTHEGTPIGRPELIRLFARLLRKDADGYVLVTPVEKISIQVEDLPFIAVDFDLTAATMSVLTNIGDRVQVGPDHPINLSQDPNGKAVPMIRIRGDLHARFSRAAYYRLIDAAMITDAGDAIIDAGGLRHFLGSS